LSGSQGPPLQAGIFRIGNPHPVTSFSGLRSASPLWRRCPRASPSA